MDKVPSTLTREISLANYELSDYVVRIKRILILYMVIFNINLM